MKFHIIAVMDDGTTLIADTDGRDLRRWEAEYKSSWIGQQFSYTHLCQLAYLALRRTKRLNGRWPTYATFDQDCVEITTTSPNDAGETIDGELIANPTPSEATDEHSAT